MSKTRRVSAIETEERRQQKFIDLARQFRATNETPKVKRLGDRLGRMVFNTNAPD
jgi:hypothetical protein